MAFFSTVFLFCILCYDLDPFLIAVSHHHLDQSVNLHTFIDQQTFLLYLSFFNSIPFIPHQILCTKCTPYHSSSKPKPKPNVPPSTLNLTLNLNFSRNLKPNRKSKTHHKISTKTPMPTLIRQNLAPQHRASRAGIVKSRYLSPLLSPPSTPSTPQTASYSRYKKKMHSGYKLIRIKIKLVRPPNPLQHMPLPRPPGTVHLHINRHRPLRHEIRRDNRGLAPENPRP